MSWTKANWNSNVLDDSEYDQQQLLEDTLTKPGTLIRYRWEECSDWMYLLVGNVNVYTGRCSCCSVFLSWNVDGAPKYIEYQDLSSEIEKHKEAY